MAAIALGASENKEAMCKLDAKAFKAWHLLQIETIRRRR